MKLHYYESYPFSDRDTEFSVISKVRSTSLTKQNIMLTFFDYTVLIAILLSSFHGAWRGFISEVFCLICWIIGFVIVSRHSLILMPYIPVDWPGGKLTQCSISFALLVIGIMFIVGISNMLLSRVIRITGIFGNCYLGMMFGVVRGMLLVIVVVIAAEFTELPRQDFWRNALLRPYTEQGVKLLRKFLPNGISKNIRV